LWAYLASVYVNDAIDPANGELVNPIVQNSMRDPVSDAKAYLAQISFSPRSGAAARLEGVSYA
jgi:hypothetical protein